VPRFPQSRSPLAGPSADVRKRTGIRARLLAGTDASAATWLPRSEELPRQALLGTRTLWLQSFIASHGPEIPKSAATRRCSGSPRPGDLTRELLERSDLGVEQIADRVGLGAGANLRLHFHRILSTSPSDYRHTFVQPIE